MKINVVGTSGSGKSTFARRLAEKLGCPHVELDALFWGPNWSETSDAEFFRRIEEALSGHCWVVDGNYTRAIPVKWRDVDAVVWLDYGFFRTLRQAVLRAVRRAWCGEELWQGTGNRETFFRSFFSRDSVVLWTIRTYAENRRRNEQLMHDPSFGHIRFVRFRKPEDAEGFIESL